jgi:two-component system, OmpR family, response regulator RegX3
MQLLLIESDTEGAVGGLAEGLHRGGHEVTRVRNGNDAIAHDPLDFVLLNRDLPDLDGHEVCRRLRAASPVPIIMMSERADETDRVLALHLGADDYVDAPFRLRELLARIEAVSRRCGRLGPAIAAARAAADGAGSPSGAAGSPSGGEGSPSGGAHGAVSTLGALVLDQRQRRVFLGHEELRLTRKEFDLLTVLMEDPGAALTRETLLRRVWDDNWFGSTRTVDTHVSQLRAKLGDARWIETVRGVGFRLVEPQRA